MSVTQPSFDFEPAGQTLCGYCDRPIEPTGRGDYACPHCAPKLALIRTDEDWIMFHRTEDRAARRRGSRRGPPARIRASKGSAGVVHVGRGSRWANPFAAKIRNGETGLATASRQMLVDDYREWLLTECWTDPRTSRLARSHQTAIVGHLGVPFHGRPSLDEVRAELAGKDLACSCHLSQPCHADVLLELANAPVPA